MNLKDIFKSKCNNSKGFRSFRSFSKRNHKNPTRSDIFHNKISFNNNLFWKKKNQFWHYAFLVALLQIRFPIREFEEKPFCKQVPFCACDCAPLTTASPFCSIWEALCRWQLIEILLHFPLGRHTLLIPMLRAHYCCCCCCCWEVAREPAG